MQTKLPICSMPEKKKKEKKRKKIKQLAKGSTRRLSWKESHRWLFMCATLELTVIQAPESEDIR